MKDLSCKLLVIGAGPGGYVCAIRAGQLGVDTIIVEKQAAGGTCLNVGCIPSKAMIHAGEVFHQATVNQTGSEIGIKAGKPKIQLKKTVAWKDGIVTRLTGGVSALLKKNKVRRLDGEASLVDGKTVDVETAEGTIRVTAENVVIATGSVPVELASLPFGENTISSTEALSLSAVPEKLAVIGGGYIGLELGTAYAKLGSEVTIVEAESRILAQYDAELTKPVAKRLDALGMSVRLDSLAVGLNGDQDALIIETKSGDKEELLVDKVLVTVGRKPLTEGWGRENVFLEMDGPFLKIDDQCQTSMANVYAIGDVTGEPMLAHRAMAQGEMVAEIVAGHNLKWDKRVIPAICFTDPEVLCAGLSPNEAKDQGFEIETAMFPFAANGRAMTVEHDEGFVRVVARKDNHLILGLQAVGHGVSELASGFALAIEMGACLEDIAGTVHAHPSLGEAVQESTMRSLGRALHI
nr:dihydrolipoyl dehydrogenase [Hyphomonas sp. Mor2]